ncbi:hypothetical protein A3H26_02670 [candidate division WWE3 bacterium RIFCSPLOWO2_12_FULL_36_10]|uniref:Uncharacterized protein n=1 Tax=candidate division WWE3 bacterium RIFCSPLOWO2_12_FULL_36_10 TaxID=1802630 RepID=A0A1F4VJQ4_UNCKA|nr:MAG: hypothetical protein A3H26_02670 [candidate division WWE3 bacterium RIFCSPLOWO2_12_FULL_36_10]
MHTQREATKMHKCKCSACRSRYRRAGLKGGCRNQVDLPGKCLPCFAGLHQVPLSKQDIGFINATAPRVPNLLPSERAKRRCKRF